MIGGYEPNLYDVVTPESFAGDVSWYRRQARECGGPVLELGAGTGRVTLAMADDGVAVHALDLDPAMLDALRRKSARRPQATRAPIVLVEGDMRTFRLTERFALIIAPFRTLLHNLTEDDLVACLSNVRAHLRPGGRFAFNVFHPSLEFMSKHAGALTGVWHWAGTFPREDGTYLIRSEAISYDTVLRRVHCLHRFEEYGSDNTLRRTFMHRLELSYLYASDIRRLMQQAGFGQVQIWGGFDERPFAKDADELVVMAARD